MLEESEGGVGHESALRSHRVGVRLVVPAEVQDLEVRHARERAEPVVRHVGVVDLELLHRDEVLELAKAVVAHARVLERELLEPLEGTKVPRPRIGDVRRRIEA